MSVVLKKVIFLPLEIKKGEKIGNKMKMRYFKGLLAGVIVTLLSFQASSQTLELGVFGGGSYYIGDMNTALPFVKTNLAYGALARYNVNNRWSFKFGYNRGEVKGDDTQNAFINGNGLNFQTKVNDFSLVAEFNFFDYFTGSKKSYFTPYLFAGIGFFTFNPKSYEGVVLQPLGTEGQNEGFAERSPYKKFGVSFPFGIGFKYSLSERIGLGLEWGMRKTFTDYIDDVSTSYYLVGAEIDPSNLAGVQSDPTLNHDPYMQRGNSGTKDWVSFFGLSVTYKINLVSRLKCNMEGW
jgi:hypothetical protein